MVSVRRVAPVLLLAMTIALPAVAAKHSKSSSTRPPKQLHLVGDHWTPYLPPDPATYPPNARTHTVKAGDTLWALAKQYLNDAYLWPQIWESNTWVTDAHWIYPGDVLLIGGEVTQAAATESGKSSGLTGGEAMTRTAPETPESAGTGATTPAVRESPPIPLGTEADVYCYGYIGDPNEPMPNTIAAFEDVEIMTQPGDIQAMTASTGDLVYVNGGTSTGLVSGETYMMVEAGEMIYHPRTRVPIGRHYWYQGQIRILCAEDTRSRGMITQSCREVAVGTRLKPMPQIPIPIARIPELPAFCDPQTNRTSGYVVNSRDVSPENAELGVGAGSLVQVSVGRDDQVEPGDFLTVYRETPGLPPQVVGEIGILTTESHTATGRVVQSSRQILIGDAVQAR